MNYWEQLLLYRIPYTLAQKLCLLEYGERETLSPLLVLADQPEPFYFLLLISAQIQKKKKNPGLYPYTLFINPFYFVNRSQDAC